MNHMLPAAHASLLLALLVVLAIWGGVMQRACKFKRPSQPFWPFAEKAGLALELADSQEFVTRILGPADTPDGRENRSCAVRFQQFDFIFIVLYALFFSVAAFAITHSLGAWIAVAAVLLTAFLDVGEDIQILRMVASQPSGSAKRFGQAKWIFYFSTLMVEGTLLLFARPPSNQAYIVNSAIGALLIVIGLGGMNSARKLSFVGILSAADFSLLAFIGLALAPLIARSPVALSVIAEYAVLLRIPLLLVALLLLLPVVAFFTAAKSLLRGLFDLTPLSLFVVTLTTLALSGSACMIAYLILAHGAERFNISDGIPSGLRYPWWAWLAAMLVLAAPIVLVSLWFSAKQKRGLPQLWLAVVCGTLIAAGAATGLIVRKPALVPASVSDRLEQKIAGKEVFAGYVPSKSCAFGAICDPWQDHLRAVEVFLCTLGLYALVGIYGRYRLGKPGTVPALCSALMLAMMIGWMLSAVAFFFDFWHVPTLAIVLLVGIITAQSRQSDHFYILKPRNTPILAPDPATTIQATGTRRVILAAANGGGIQAAAWAAQVLYGLCEDCRQDFRKSLRMISSVSGGSVGNACFVGWLADPVEAKRPDKAASESSLDEVAWGLAWPDFIRALVPWIVPKLIGRGRALERAWCTNSAASPSERPPLDEPLSDWNTRVANGELPAVVMNGTISETGERFLMATTRIGPGGRARVDAAQLHIINGKQFDIAAVTAARLSATFPYVTPASRSDGPGPQPHIVDGGYYDNYGMATLVEWLDAALTQGEGHIESVLVIQIHGAPIGSENSQGGGNKNDDGGADSENSDTKEIKNRGWFYQAIAPLLTLDAVRSSGQVAHNDIELSLLQQKWAAAGVPIHTVVFEFPKADAPLSWHLTREEIEAIGTAWNSQRQGQNINLVHQFLAGSDRLSCGCPKCSLV
jgi:hypothetical protein